MKDNWDDCNLIDKADILGYCQIRDNEDAEQAGTFLSILFKGMAGG